MTQAQCTLHAELTWSEQSAAQAEAFLKHAFQPTGGKFCFVWDIVQRTCRSITRPLVLFIKDAEHTICDSYEREAAFQEAFGVRVSIMDAPGESKRTAAVLIAGCSLGDTGADIAPQTL